MHVCVFRVGARRFSCLVFGFTWGGERNVEQVRSFPPLQELRSEKKKKLPKSRPQLPSLSASFRRFLITRLRLRSVQRPPSSSPSRGPLFFVYLPPLLAHANHFNASCLLICLTRVKRQITPPLQCHLPLSSQCFFRSVENQELPQIMLRFNQPCRAFFFFCWDRAAASIQNLFAEAIHAQFWRCLFSL